MGDISNRALMQDLKLLDVAQYLVEVWVFTAQDLGTEGMEKKTHSTACSGV